MLRKDQRPTTPDRTHFEAFFWGERVDIRTQRSQTEGQTKVKESQPTKKEFYTKINAEKQTEKRLPKVQRTRQRQM